MKKYVFALTGATGSVVGIRVLQETRKGIRSPSAYIFTIIPYHPPGDRDRLVC